MPSGCMSRYVSSTLPPANYLLHAMYPPTLHTLSPPLHTADETVKTCAEGWRVSSNNSQCIPSFLSASSTR